MKIENDDFVMYKYSGSARNIHFYAKRIIHSVNKISELIPLNKIGIDAFLNEPWNKIIIPEMIYTMMIRVLCQDNIN